MSQTVNKVCRFCRTDVSGKPRIKDKKGRYACQPCFERLKEKRGSEAQAPAIAAPSAAFDPDIDTESIALALEEPTAAATPSRACPSCSAAIGANDVFCIHCGTNVQTGGKLGKVKVKKAKSRPDKSARSRGEKGFKTSRSDEGIVVFISLAIVVSFAIGIRPALEVDSEGGLLLALSLLALCIYSLTVQIALLVSAFREGGVGQFLLTLLVPFYMAYWAFFRASRLLRISTLLLILTFAAVATILALNTLWVSEGWVEQGSISGIGNRR